MAGRTKPLPTRLPGAPAITLLPHGLLPGDHHRRGLLHLGLRRVIWAGRGPGLAEHREHRWRPLSAGVAVPVFAFFAAGVTLGGWSGLGESLSSRVAVGVVAALIIGKTIGVLGATYLTARFTRAELDPDLAWVDVVGLALLCGVGFTVSLLIGELAFGADTAQGQQATVAVVAGSLGAALLAAIVLRLRNRVYRRICEEESLDLDGDHIPDVFQGRRQWQQ